MENLTDNTTTALKLLEVDQKFVLEVASGVRDPEVIAAEYGYEGYEWDTLKTFAPFIKAVDTKKAELRATGYTFRMKAAMGAEELLAEVFNKATSDGVSFHTQLEALKFMARAAGLEAPPKEESDSGAKFTISINLGGGNIVEIGGKTTQKTVINDEKEPYYVRFDPVDIEIPYDSTPLFELQNA